jgi:hypothetical protein
MKSGNLNFLEPSGPLQACKGAALPLPMLQRVVSATLAEVGYKRNIKLSFVVSVVTGLLVRKRVHGLGVLLIC